MYPLSRHVSTRAELIEFTRIPPLGLLQGLTPEDYPLKPASRGSESKTLAGLGPGEVAKPAQLARRGPGSPPQG